jgi:ATP-dependent Clp protease protease subunit
MDAETWLNANKAVELGFADDIMFKPGESSLQDSFVFSRRAVTNSLMNKLQKPVVKQSVEPLYERLNLLKY